MQKSANLPSNGSVRPLIEFITPEIAGGRYPIRRVIGEKVEVKATIIIDGHELLSCTLLYRHETDHTWTDTPMTQYQKGKDLWGAAFPIRKLGRYFYTVRACIDRFITWQTELIKRHEAGQELTVEFLAGAELVKQAAQVAQGSDRNKLLALSRRLLSFGKKNNLSGAGALTAVSLAKNNGLTRLMTCYPESSSRTSYHSEFESELEVIADSVRTRFSTWYEFFPRSASGVPGQHGTFNDCTKMLPYIASLGFDVIYLPPIHPIGITHRKGKNNSLFASHQDPGSPWGIGSKDGGHKAIHPELSKNGTKGGALRDFKRFVASARKLGCEVAMDIAFQCSPDHPYVKEHPEWFRRRPDGSIQYAENPPKKYQDIYPFNFECREWRTLWRELESIVLFWINHGVRIFRVDNPHTKSFRFWRWMIADIKKRHPEVIFLAEAFTKPAIMYHLARIGFAQSYTYFTWRNTKKDFQTYIEELTRTEVAEFYQPNFWPNTPDILPTHLQKGLPAAFKARYALAATLSSCCGIYGPAYELIAHQPMHEGGEEYFESEKYEIKAWDLKSPRSIGRYIAAVNRIRKHNPAFHFTRNIKFQIIDNDQILCFAKQTEDRTNTVVIAINLDVKNKQAGNIELGLASLGLDSAKNLRAEDLLGKKSLKWKGTRHPIVLDPEKNPVAIFRLSS